MAEAKVAGCTLAAEIEARAPDMSRPNLYTLRVNLRRCLRMKGLNPEEVATVVPRNAPRKPTPFELARKARETKIRQLTDAIEALTYSLDQLKAHPVQEEWEDPEA